jgi:hypothetical protein
MLDLRSFVVMSQVKSDLVKDLLPTFLGEGPHSPEKEETVRRIVTKGIDEVFARPGYQEMIYRSLDSKKAAEKLIRIVCENIVKKLQGD